MKLSSSYILPVIFCVLSHELWSIWSPAVENNGVAQMELCFDEVEVDECTSTIDIMMTEEKC